MLWKSIGVVSGVFLLAGVCVAQQASKRSMEERYSPRLGVYYRLIPFGDMYAAVLTRPPVIGSPLNQNQILLEQGDAITHLDNVPIRDAGELELHHSQTSVAFINVRTRRHEARWALLPFQPQPIQANQQPQAENPSRRNDGAVASQFKPSTQSEGVLTLGTSLNLLPMDKPTGSTIMATMRLTGKSFSSTFAVEGTNLRVVDQATGVVGEPHEIAYLVVNDRTDEVKIDRSGKTNWYKVAVLDGEAKGETGWVLEGYVKKKGKSEDAWIKTITVDLTTQTFKLTWEGDEENKQNTGPFRCSTGAGIDAHDKSQHDCDEIKTSQTEGSGCTPKGSWVVINKYPNWPSEPDAKNVVQFSEPKRAIGLHYFPVVPDHPASHGCVRIAEIGISKLVYEKSIVNKTTVVVEGRWSLQGMRKTARDKGTL